MFGNDAEAEYAKFLAVSFLFPNRALLPIHLILLSKLNSQKTLDQRHLKDENKNIAPQEN